MTTDKPEPSNPSPPRRTMNPVLRELLKDPCFRQVKSPRGAVIITGIRPPDPPTPSVPPVVEPPPDAEPASAPPSSPKPTENQLTKE